MNLTPLSREQIRQVDQIAVNKYGIPGVVLMENAGRGAAEAIHRLVPKGEIVILAGKGNNAGDGYVIERHLSLLGHKVRIVSLVDPMTLSGDALINAKIAIVSDSDLIVANDAVALEASMRGFSVIVDCLLGTGAVGPLREPFDVAVQLANQCDAIRIAIDIPTGMNCDTGELNEPTFRADHTLTFVATKIGFANAASHVGRVQVISIGVPQKLIDDMRASGITAME